MELELEHYMKMDDYLICTGCYICTDIRDWMYVDQCPICSLSIDEAVGYSESGLTDTPVVGDRYDI